MADKNYPVGSISKANEIRCTRLTVDPSNPGNRIPCTPRNLSRWVMRDEFADRADRYFDGSGLFPMDTKCAHCGQPLVSEEDALLGR